MRDKLQTQFHSSDVNRSVGPSHSRRIGPLTKPFWVPPTCLVPITRTSLVVIKNANTSFTPKSFINTQRNGDEKFYSAPGELEETECQEMSPPLTRFTHKGASF